jgi:cytochrome c biogenesis protein CcmG, thiol:disulfide interchange protein DsbE
MKTSERARVAAGAVIALLLGACGRTPGVAVGSPAPEFALPGLDGALVDSASLGGEPVVLNFWATWCGPCRREVPDLQRLAAENGARVVGIALDRRGAETVKPFVERYGLDYTILLDDGAVAGRYGISGIPYTFVLAPSQEIVGIYRGTVSREELEAALRKAAAAG